MRKLNFNEIVEAIKQKSFEKFDLVVAVGRGGLVPGALIAKQLNIDLKVLWLKFKDDQMNEIYDKPKLVKPINFNYRNKKILLVDDFCKTGKTLESAREILKGAKIKTFVVNGTADYSIYQYKECLKFPWN